MPNDRYRSLEDETFDIVVVGAGLGGLTAAALLARKGKHVLVLDQHALAGGNATIFQRGRYTFDIGVHYIGGCDPGGPIPRILQAAGTEPVVFESLDPEGFDTLAYPDFLFRVPTGIDRFRDRLVQYFPNETDGIDRYVEFLRLIEARQRTGLARTRTLGNLLRSLRLARWANKTFKALLDSCTKDPWLQAVLAGQHGDYALPPSRASALVGAGLALHYLQGAYFPRGGGQVLSDALAAAIERHGGKILLMSRVLRILTEAGRVVGVELESRHVGRRTVRAATVISNADLKRTYLDLLDPTELRGATLERVRNYEMAPALGMLYLGYGRDLRAENHPATNYWIYPTYDYEADYATVRGGGFPLTPFAYISLASLKDPTHEGLAPPGVTNMQVMSLAPHRPESWGVTSGEARSGAYRNRSAYLEAKERYGQRLLATASRIFPDLPETVLFQELATPLTQSRYTGSTGGTSYGIAATPDQYLRHRPGCRTEIEGLYLCGSNTRMGHGVGGVTLSGLYAAATIVDRRLVQEVLGDRPQLA
jgi:all-trans-retinol 13,14-reductase